MSDYYEILGVPKTASQQEIKSAYRKLAVLHHPDKGGDINKFQEISEAYDTLSDTGKRAAYDNPQTNNNQGFGFNGGMPPGFEDLFSEGSPFGNIFGFKSRTPTNSNIQFSTSINLEDVFYGKEIIANVTLPSGVEQTINIKIPVGIHDGSTLRLAGMGDDSIKNAPRGDILLAIHINHHPEYFRSGDDLIKEIEVSCIDAMIGTTIEITTIDDRKLHTEIPAGTQNDTVFNLAGFGLPNFNSPDRRGRLLLKTKIKIPILSDEQKEELRKLNV